MNFDGIYNYHERLVYQAVLKALTEKNIPFDIDIAEDIACLALNQLPARYVRHSVDAAFYIDSNDRRNMDQAVTKAVAHALERVIQNPPDVD